MLYFILFLGALVFFHEFGHFIVARLVGVKVLRLSIGFGPKLVGFTRSGTEYWLALIPLGGYVKLLGDDPEKQEVDVDPRQGFFTTDLWRRILIVLAGPIFSLLLPVLLFFPMFVLRSELPPSVVGSVAVGGPAWQAGLRPGDRVVEALGREIKYFWQLQEVVESNPGQAVPVVVDRGGERREFVVTPATVEDPIFREIGFSVKTGRIEVTLESSRPVVLVEPGGAAFRSGMGQFLSLVQRVRVFEDPMVLPLVALLSVDGRDVSDFEQASEALAHVKERAVKVRVAATSDRPDDLGPVAEFVIGPTEEGPGLLDGSGVVTFVEPGSPAKQAGIRQSDRIVSVDGKAFSNWLFMVSTLERAPDEEHTFGLVGPDGSHREVRFSLKNPAWTPGSGVSRYAFGAYGRRAVLDPSPVPNEDRLYYATNRTIAQTSHVFKVTVAALVGLFVGRVSVREVGGPIMIYQVASVAGQRGWSDFFNAMAWLSMSIGILNLLPIPIMDGGNLLMFAIEAVRRRPIGSAGWRTARYVGLVVLMALAVLVFSNDLSRLAMGGR